MAQVDISTEVVINCPLDRVASYSADPDNVPNWYVNIKSVEWKTSRPVGVGSQIAFVAQFLGRRLEYTYEVAEFVTAERLVMQTSEGPFPMKTSYTWEAINGGSTRMVLRNSGEPSGFSALVTPVMSIMMRRANRKDLALLKQILENSCS